MEARVGTSGLEINPGWAATPAERARGQRALSELAWRTGKLRGVSEGSQQRAQYS